MGKQTLLRSLNLWFMIQTQKRSLFQYIPAELARRKKWPAEKVKEDWDKAQKNSEDWKESAKELRDLGVH